MGSADGERTPRLAPGCDPTALEITPAEGFLLSRIDGHTPWRLLREVGGLPPDQVDTVLERWLKLGIIVVPASAAVAGSDSNRGKARSGSAPRKPVATASAKPAPAKSGPAGSIEELVGSPVERSLLEFGDSIDESRLDDSLEIDLESQRRVLAYEAGLDRNYFAVLDVPRDADPRTLKRVYFRLSKEFHPDRYFRREIGPYLGRLENIFKKVLEAYELLSDPMARQEILKTLKEPAPPPELVVDEDAAEEQPPVRELTPIERLKQRMPFKIPAGAIHERRAKAATFFAAAQQALYAGNYLEASSSMRLAIAFDPYNPEYKSEFAEVRSKAAEKRANQLLEKSEDDSFTDEGQIREALRLLEEVLLYRPHDPKVNAKAAEVALDLDDAETAREYIERALEHSPEVAGYHVVMAKVHRANRTKGHAVRELEAALKLDSNHAEARQLLAQLRQGREMPKGGTK